MKYIELNRKQFEDIYYTLSQHVAPHNIKMTVQQSNDETIDYINNHVDFKDIIQSIEWQGEGFRLLYRTMDHRHNDSLYRSFIVSADRKNIFYEGFINPRHIDELKLSDNYFILLPEDLNYLCKKYGLTQNKL